MDEGIRGSKRTRQVSSGNGERSISAVDKEDARPCTVAVLYSAAESILLTRYPFATVQTLPNYRSANSSLLRVSSPSLVAFSFSYRSSIHDHSFRHVRFRLSALHEPSEMRDESRRA